MTDITNIPAPRVPFIDERTGLMAREWYRFFLNLFVLTGSGTSQVSIVDLSVAPSPQNPPNVAALLQSAELTQRMSRYESAISAMDGLAMVPAQKQDSQQQDPLSFCAPYAHR